MHESQNHGSVLEEKRAKARGKRGKKRVKEEGRRNERKEKRRDESKIER